MLAAALTALGLAASPARTAEPRLDDFLSGAAEWALDVRDVGLPIGESDTIVVGKGRLRSYLHASTESAGVKDSKGREVEFPGCVTAWESTDGGRSFKIAPRCLFDEHTEQQQYPRVAQAADGALYMVYEWQGKTMLRSSPDGGKTWSAEAQVPGTGVFPGECPPMAKIGKCANYESLEGAPEEGACLVGAPPGVYVEGDTLYVFVDLGSCPAHMTCYRGPRAAGAEGLSRCQAPTVLDGAATFGEGEGKEANPHFDFRYLSSADVVRDGAKYFMLFEGERGPAPPKMESQFGLGLASSARLDARWKRYGGNPILLDLPGNIGVGHGDLVRVDGVWYLYTATSPSTRGRYRLAWSPGHEEARRADRLHGTVLVDGTPRAGIVVTAWGQDARDLHQAETDAEGIYSIEGLDPDSAYNLLANAEFKDGPQARDPSLTYESRDNVVLKAGPDAWHGENFNLRSQ